MLWRWRCFRVFSIGLAVAAAAGATPAQALVMRFVTTLGNFDVRMYQTRTPLTVQNFQQYVNSNRWDGTFIHRAPDINVAPIGQPQVLEPFVVQGGGFKLAAAPQGLFGATHIQQFPAVQNEPGLTNARGTIAMAKLGNDPNSATSEWFVNTRNNAGAPPALDTQNGGFTVFGRVVGSGMTVVDAIQALAVINGGGFEDVPVIDLQKVINQQNVFTEDAVILSDVRALNIPDGDYNFDGTVNNADFTVWTTDLGSTTKAEADGNGNGVVDHADFLIWQRTRGQNLGPPTVGAVPEPAAVALAAIALAALAARCRRCS